MCPVVSSTMLVLILLVYAPVKRSVPRRLTVHESLLVSGGEYRADLSSQVGSLFMILQLFIDLPHVPMLIAHRVRLQHLVGVDAPHIDLNRKAGWLAGTDF